MKVHVRGAYIREWFLGVPYVPPLKPTWCTPRRMTTHPNRSTYILASPLAVITRSKEKKGTINNTRFCLFLFSVSQLCLASQLRWMISPRNISEQLNMRCFYVWKHIFNSLASEWITSRIQYVAIKTERKGLDDQTAYHSKRKSLSEVSFQRARATKESKQLLHGREGLTSSLGCLVRLLSVNLLIRTAKHSFKARF